MHYPQEPDWRGGISSSRTRVCHALGIRWPCNSSGGPPAGRGEGHVGVNGPRLDLPFELIKKEGPRTSLWDTGTPAPDSHKVLSSPLPR